SSAQRHMSSAAGLTAALIPLVGGKAGEGSPGFLDEFSDVAAHFPGLCGEVSMSVGAVGLALRGSPSRSMKAANGPAPDGRCSARLAGPLRGRRAARRTFEGVGPVHEVASCFVGEPLPPWVTAPTSAWPP